jgi:phage gp36-like protein
MAQYTTLVNLKNYLPASILQQLTDDNHLDKIDDEKLDFAVGQASNFIDGYLRGRYSLPLATVPDMIVDVATKLSGYFLFKRALIQTLPETIKEDYDYSIGILRDIQKGRISPFEVTQNPTWSEGNKTGSRRQVNMLSAITGNFRRYWI